MLSIFLSCLSSAPCSLASFQHFLKFSIPPSPFSNCLFSFLVHGVLQRKLLFCILSWRFPCPFFFFSTFNLFISKRLVALSAQDLQSPGYFTVIVTSYTFNVSSPSHNRLNRKNPGSDINALPSSAWLSIQFIELLTFLDIVGKRSLVDSQLLSPEIIIQKLYCLNQCLAH